MTITGPAVRFKGAVPHAGIEWGEISSTCAYRLSAAVVVPDLPESSR
ncbi:hypothetical protein BN2537_3895 [Streptomyces venezuelae]|nr:hypothetical protein BN2537_3895 [Streptomyces venezuelae]